MAPGREAPLSRIVFANGSGDAVDVSRTIGTQNPPIGALAAGEPAAYVVALAVG